MMLGRIHSVMEGNSCKTVVQKAVSVAINAAPILDLCSLNHFAALGLVRINSDAIMNP